MCGFTDKKFTKIRASVRNVGWTGATGWSRGGTLTTWLKLITKSKMRLDGDALVLIINDDAKPIEKAH
jgi:hypothetical protein